MSLTIPGIKPTTDRLPFGITAKSAASYAEYYARLQQQIKSSSGVVRASALNSQSSVREIRATVAADGSPIPLCYGQCQIGGRVFALDVTGGTWTVGVAFCLGEIDGYVKLLINGAVPVSGVLVDYYTGTTAQTVNSKLAAKISGYADTLVASTPNGSIGVAYCVVQYTSNHYDNWPSFVAEIRGKKVWNPATATTVYSANPALHLGDLLRSTIYGQGLTVDDTDLETAMDYCDETVTSEARRTAGNVLDGVQETEAWAEILRAYASCWIVRRGATAHLIPDKAAASVQTFTADDIVEGSLRVTKQDSSNLPTVVRVRYTDTSGTEWRDAPGGAVAKRDGVDAGSVPWRESVVSMPGVTRYSQAYREAVERLNKLALSDLAVEFETFDQALQREAGDVITMTHFVGLASKPLRLAADPEQVRPGRWRIVAAEYDAAAYNSSVENAPSTADGNLPEMGAPGAVAGLALTESNYQLQNGDYASRIKATWAASSDPFVTGYQITVRQGGAVIFSATTRDTEVSTPPVQELVSHQVDVYALTPLYVGAAASETITVVGKTAVPDGPASLTGYEVASEVRLAWPADLSDFDIRRYELRYGVTAGSWATATVLDQVDALTYVTRAIPEGTWRFYVNSIDSVGQYGTTPATVALVVTLDDSAYLAHAEDCTSGTPTLTYSAVEEVRGSGVTTFYSDGSDTWATMFGGAAMSTFTSSLASYQTAAGTSEWISAAVDVGSVITGDWLGEISHIDHNGAATVQMGLSTDNVSYTWGNLSVKGTARYAKLRIQSTGIFSVQVPGPRISLRVIARERNGSDTSSAGAAVTVDIGIAASDFKSVVVTPISATQYTPIVSNLDTSGATATFDVDIRTTGGARAAVDFLWATRTV